MDSITQAHGLTNSEITSPTSVTFAGKDYKLVHLPYDDYVQFMALIEPVIGTIINIINSGEFALTGNAGIIKGLLTVLPELVWLSLKQTNSGITLAYIKSNTKSPTELFNIVIAQVKHNDMIKDFSDFFAQINTMMTSQ